MSNWKINPKATFGLKTKLFALFGSVILLLGFTYSIFRGVSAWFDTHTMQFNKVVNLELKRPVEVKERQVEIREIVRVINEIPHPDNLETDTEKYIYEVFGIENYKIAIAIARAESGLRDDAIGINPGSVDIGVFQINSTHFKQEGCSLAEVATIQGNIDCAYQIYQASGWNPWVVFQSGAFTNNLK